MFRILFFFFTLAVFFMHSELLLIWMVLTYISWLYLLANLYIRKNIFPSAREQISLRSPIEWHFINHINCCAGKDFLFLYFGLKLKILFMLYELKICEASAMIYYNFFKLPPPMHITHFIKNWLTIYVSAWKNRSCICDN
jgi:hypothetical protein